MSGRASEVDDGGASGDTSPDTSPAAATRRTHRSHRFKVARRAFGRWFARTVGPLLVRALTATWRVRFEGAEHIANVRAEGGYFMALWHGRMLIPAARHGRQGYRILVSPSGDGDVSEAMLNGLGYGVVRGSRSKNSRAALREMLDLLRAGTPIAITPDGPRGPRHVMSDGLAWMASATGFPVIPCGFVPANAWRLSSWDRFVIPKPFSQVAFVYGAPLRLDRHADGGLEGASERIRVAIEAAERRGFELLGVEPDG